MIGAGVLTILVWSTQRWAETGQREVMGQAVHSQIQVLAHLLAPDLAAGDRAGVRDILRFSGEKAGLSYLVVADDRGRPIATWEDPGGGSGGDHPLSGAGGELLDTATPIRVEGQAVGALRAGYNTAGLQGLTERARLQSLAIAGTGLVLAVAVAALLAWRRSQKLRRLGAGAKALAMGEYSHRIPVTARDDLGEVATALNQLAEGLAATRSELEEKNRLLEHQTRHFQTLLDGIEAVVIEADPYTLHPTFVSQEAADLLGWSVSKWFLPDFWESHVHPEDLELFQHQMAANAERPGSFVADFRMLHRDGHPVWVRAVNAIDRAEEGHPVLRGLLLDVTEEKLSEQRILYLAEHDLLTGLFNRRRFQEELDRHITHAKGYGHEGVLIVAGLDAFKYINDTLGHQTGDHYLYSVASALTALASKVDIVGRLGGDEFGIIRPKVTREEVETLAAELRQRLAYPPVRSEDYLARVTASMGVVFFPTNGVAPEELLAKADAALHSAKEAGGNGLHVFDERDEALGRMRAKIEWEDRIRRALTEDRFVLNYQPVCRLDTGEVRHYEALLRMVSDDGSLIGPGAFLETAERFGMIRDIDHWVVDRAIRAQGESEANGRPVDLAINLSGRHLGRDEVRNWVTRALAEHRADPYRLIFEVTETAAVENIAQAQKLIQDLRQRGCRVALDDFGVGLSSFHYLKNLPLDMIKIDGSFVRTLDRDPFDRTFVQAMSDLAKSLGIDCVAEYVEREAIATLLREVGVELGQGFYLARPESDFTKGPGPAC